MNIALTGDIMLGRLVDQYIVGNSTVPPARIWGDVLPLLLSADLRLCNLECVISTRGQRWKPFTKAFHFRAHPRAIDILRAAHFDCVTLANNHTLDFGSNALLECLTLLDQAGILHTGVGENLDEALSPALLEHSKTQIGVVALTDNEPEWEATSSQPGINYVAFNDHGLIPSYRVRIADMMRKVHEQASFVIVSAHVGPNWGTPSPAIQALAHELLDLGADLVWGHSNHTPQGIEIFKGKVILYSTGDFVDDYAVDSTERNDLSFLFVIEMDRGQVSRLQLHPVCIANYGVRRAQGKEVTFLHKTIAKKCGAFGTRVSVRDHVGTIVVS